jgi:hypothetical protein
MTYKILTADRKQIIFRSSVRSADTSSAPNLRTALFDGETDSSIPRIVKSKHESSNLSNDLMQLMPLIEPYDDNKFYPDSLDETTTPDAEATEANPQDVMAEIPTRTT